MGRNRASAQVAEPALCAFVDVAQARTQVLETNPYAFERDLKKVAIQLTLSPQKVLTPTGTKDSSLHTPFVVDDTVWRSVYGDVGVGMGR